MQTPNGSDAAALAHLAHVPAFLKDDPTIRAGKAGAAWVWLRCDENNCTHTPYVMVSGVSGDDAARLDWLETHGQLVEDDSVRGPPGCVVMKLLPVAAEVPPVSAMAEASPAKAGTNVPSSLPSSMEGSVKQWLQRQKGADRSAHWPGVHLSCQMPYGGHYSGTESGLEAILLAARVG